MKHRAWSRIVLSVAVGSLAVSRSPRLATAAPEPGASPAGVGPGSQPPSQPQAPYPDAAPPPVYTAAPAPVYAPTPLYVPAGSVDAMGNGKAKLELVGDFAALGMLAGFTVADARDLGGSDPGVLMVMGSTLGGAATGWLLAERLQPTAGEANATTLGLALGASNGLLLLAPTNLDDDTEEALPFILLSSTAGAVGGLVLGQKMSLTRGQSTFAANLAFLGIGTTALAAALGDRDDELGGGESATLAVGLDAGAAAGLIIAPHIDWAPNRARFVFASTLVGAFLGGMTGSMLGSERGPDGDKELDPDAVSASLLVGMWAGFLGGAKLTADWVPDAKYARAATAPAVAVVPRVGAGQLGLAVSGAF